MCVSAVLKHSFEVLVLGYWYFYSTTPFSDFLIKYKRIVLWWINHVYFITYL